MSKIGTWNTTAGSNNATPPDGWPEGQAPSTVNDCAREMMAQIRAAFSDLQFFDQGLVPTYINATSFSIPGDQTSAIHAGRRLKLFDATTVYATILTASYTAVTTVQLTADAATLTTSLSSFATAIISVNNPSVNIPNAPNIGTLSALVVLTNLATNALSVSATATFGTIAAKNSSLTCVAAGGFICTGDVTAFSDERLKTNWRLMEPDFVNKLANVQAGTYDRIDSGQRQAGVNAQQLQKLLPEAVHGNAEEQTLSVAYGNAALLATIELAKELRRLRWELGL